MSMHSGMPRSVIVSRRSAQPEPTRRSAGRRLLSSTTTAAKSLLRPSKSYTTRLRCLNHTLLLLTMQKACKPNRRTVKRVRLTSSQSFYCVIKTTVLLPPDPPSMALRTSMGNARTKCNAQLHGNAGALRPALAMHARLLTRIPVGSVMRMWVRI